MTLRGEGDLKGCGYPDGASIEIAERDVSGDAVNIESVNGSAHTDIHGVAGYIAFWISRHVTSTTLLSFSACFHSGLVTRL